MYGISKLCTVEEYTQGRTKNLDDLLSFGKVCTTHSINHWSQMVFVMTTTCSNNYW